VGGSVGGSVGGCAVTGPVVVLIPPSACGAGYFARVRRVVARHADVRVVELPGHGRRFAEPLLTRAWSAVVDVAARLDGPVDVVYGESLGAYVALALVDALPARARPSRLVVASNSPPSVRDPIDLTGVTSMATAAAVLRTMGGEVPDEALSDPAVAARAYPLLRADLHLSQSFVDLTRELVVDVPVEVLAGTDDVALTGLERWSRHTTAGCTLTRLRGGHLLSRADPDGVAATVLRTVPTP